MKLKQIGVMLPFLKSAKLGKKGLVVVSKKPKKKPHKNQTLGVVSLKPTKETTQEGSYRLDQK